MIVGVLGHVERLMYGHPHDVPEPENEGLGGWCSGWRPREAFATPSGGRANSAHIRQSRPEFGLSFR